jgi:hypothetical protein
MCKSKDGNKEVSSSSAEKPLNLSLIFYSGLGNKTPYTIDPSVIRNVEVYPNVNDSLIISNNNKFAELSDSAIRESLIRYSFYIINDSLIIKNENLKEYVKLTDDQYLEIEKMISVLNQKYDRTDNFDYATWGCVLKVDNQIYYQDNFFELESYPNWGPPPIPEEIRLLIVYILGLSPIPIVFFGDLS